VSLLSVKNLSIEFETLRGRLRAVDGISFKLDEGETLGVVGESGCGKSLTSLAVMGLLPPNAIVKADELNFKGIDLLTADEEVKRDLRGGKMAMIFQDPMTSLNPSFTIEYQLDEALRVHGRGNKSERRQRSIEMLRLVGIPDPESRLGTYPHELSGGMSQRVMIAMAMTCDPLLLIADEPTTALDVTIQSQILALIQELQKKNKMGLMLITHDIGVVAEMADRIQVMYSGQIVETGSSENVIQRPIHPYTAGLLRSLPSAQGETAHRSRLKSIAGLVPDLVHRPSGCQFHPRCEFVQEKCRSHLPEIETKSGREVRCFYPLENSAAKGAQP
jgi:oligopeptide/dipeptide ABC transporter ATP-binding protein